MRRRRPGTRLQVVPPVSSPSRRGARYVLITGGAGFVGCNLADRLCGQGEQVLLFDNLSRAGVEQNVQWVCQKHPGAVHVVTADVGDDIAVREAVQGASSVFHLAAQVAVTSSLSSPLQDFEVNARGTLNLLEALRALARPPPLIFTSTNKVYGCLRDIRLRLRGDRYEPANKIVRSHAIAETQPLDFCAPYGCSKGAADQYVLDYANSFSLPAIVFRMSCIYGPHQFGTEDQGWVAHFLIQAMNGQPITIYGDGKQVRDLLFIDDLIDAFLLARERVETIAGNAFNIGGGKENTTSLVELVEMIRTIGQRSPQIAWSDWRRGDQRYYVTDYSKFQAATDWRPKIGLEEGVRRLHEWLAEDRDQPPAELATA